MLRIFTQGLCPEILNFSPKPIPPSLLTCMIYLSWMSGPDSSWSLWFKGQDPEGLSLVSGQVRVASLQMCRAEHILVSAYTLSSGCHGILGTCIAILSEWCPWVLVNRFSHNCVYWDSLTKLFQMSKRHFLNYSNYRWHWWSQLF